MSIDGTRITALATGTVINTTLDWFVYVDVSDTAMAPTGTDKRVSLATIAAALVIGQSQVTNLTTDLATITNNLAAAGTVTAVSVASANGFAGSVATDTTTPAISIETTVTGILLGDGTGVAAATIGSGLDLTDGVLSATDSSAGTVTSASVVTANGFGGSVATATTTPAITITTTVTGILMGNGTGVSAATGADIPAIAESKVTGLVGDLATLTAAVAAAGTLQTITLTGDVTGSGTGSFAATIATNAVTTSKINAGAVTEAKLTLADVTTGNVTTSAHGFAPKAPNDATKYLDGTGGYSVPPGTGGSGSVTTVSVVTANGVSGTVATATTTPAITLTLGAITPSSVAATGSVTGSNLSGTNTGDQTITLTGAVTGSGTGSFATTLATQASHTILANVAGSTAAPTAATLTAVLDMISAGQGDILYRGATVWTTRTAGTSGQYFKTLGPGANPIWDDAPGSSPTTGGTGLTSYVLGDILYASATNVLSTLAGNITTTKKWLSQTGVGASSAAPAWGVIAGSDLPNPSASTLGGVQSYAAVTSQWIRAISTAGVPSGSQPAFTDISGTVAASQLPNPSASTLGGIQSAAAVSHQWINSISTSGVPSLSQPAFTDISGTVAASQLPNPSSSTLGGVQSKAAVSNQFLTSISTSGVPASAQPAFTDISGVATVAQLPTVGLVIGTHTAPITTDTDGATVTFDLGVTDWHQVTLGGNRTLALSNATTGQVFYLKLIQDGTGSRTVTWFTTITWYTSNFVAPVLPAGAGKAILVGFRCTGSGTYDGFMVGASGA